MSQPRLKVLFLPIDNLQRASSRVRVYELAPYLERQGLKVGILHAKKGRNIFQQILYVLKFLAYVLRYDVVVIQKTTPQKAFAILLSLLSRCLIYDFDDAIHAMHPASEGSEWEHDRYRKRVPRLNDILKRSNAVFCGNDYLADIASKINSQVYIIPSCIDMELYKKYSINRQSLRNRPVVFGWIGQEKNLVDFEPIIPALKEVFRDLQGQAILRILSSKPLQIDGLAAEFVPWTIDGQYKALAECDVGLMPLMENERSLGRCGYKAIQYMGIGLPVICSDVGDASRIIVHQQTGFVARNAEDWKQAIKLLTGDAALRTRLGQAGRDRAEQEYSFQSWAPRIATILRDLPSNAKHAVPFTPGRINPA